MKLSSSLMILLLPLLAACGGGDDAGSTAASTATGDDGSDGVTASSNVDNSEGDGTEWRVEYTGDLDGVVSGTILSVTGIGANTMLAGADMNDEMTGAANHSFRAQISQYGDTPTASFTLTLGDGTTCNDVTAADPESSSVNILDAERATFRAEFDGVLHCGPDKDQRIEYTALVDADP